MELVLFCVALLAGIGLLLWRAERDGGPKWPAPALAAGCALLAVGGRAVSIPPGDPTLRSALPGPVTDGGFATSNSCRACHPGAHDRWHESFHRRMTQPATPASVLGDFDNVVLRDRGHTCRLERRGDEFFVDMVDPFWFYRPKQGIEPPRIQVRVVMTTGSHHLQTYWVRRPTSGDVYLKPDDGALMQLPWVWLIDEGRWIPTQDSFLTPPSSQPERLLPWNASCSMCHSVATQPRLSKTFATRSVELGIACEACHGPGDAHIRANRSPLRRYAAHLTDARDTTIRNPAHMTQQRSAEVCGQCHSFHKELDMKRWQTTGVAFRAGAELGQTKAVFRYSENPTHPRLLQHLKAEPDALKGRFWPDGTIRVAGREFNGLLESGCYQRGSMTCLSCHSMHDYASAADQLTRDQGEDESCLQCHGAMRGRVEEHTHHRRLSAGSRCVNCHMPHTTLGLFVAMRSHRIDSPNATTAAASGRPNACNICHLDRTLDWTARHLTSWYGQPPARLQRDERTIAASVLWAAKGDAAQRMVSAWAMGWPPAREASGRGWLGFYLAKTPADPYAVIRRVGYRSLRTLPEFAGFEYDFVGPATRHRQRAVAAVARWRETAARGRCRTGPAILVQDGGNTDDHQYRHLLDERDLTPLRIIE